MGFTRYWIRPRELDRERFAVYADACDLRCGTLDVGMQKEVFSAEVVGFDAEPGCEPFRIERISQGRERDGRITEYCKTRQLPYDRAVEVCVELLQKHFPEVTIPLPS